MTQDVTALLKGTSLYLVGMPGSGKTTFGQRLAERLGYGFFDTDQMIESAVGQTTNQIFAESGEKLFRELERQVLAELSPYGRCVIATGGGIVLKPENWSHLRNGVVLWLDVPLDLLLGRLASDSSRPLLAGDLPERLAKLQADRSHLYAQADLRLVVGAGDHSEMLVARAVDLLVEACETKARADADLLDLNRSVPFEAS
jgi:shikimate kinase